MFFKWQNNKCRQHAANIRVFVYNFATSRLRLFATPTFHVLSKQDSRIRMKHQRRSNCKQLCLFCWAMKIKMEFHWKSSETILNDRHRTTAPQVMANQGHLNGTPEKMKHMVERLEASNYKTISNFHYSICHTVTCRRIHPLNCR